jgi:hypothetical protein
MTRRTGRSNSGDTFIGCLPAGLILLVVAGAALYLVVPGLLKDADRKVLPWLESKGRVLLGKVALEPLFKTMTRSELTPAEKKEWQDFLLKKWELASVSRDQRLRREFLINSARDAVATYPGLYYALLAVGDRDFDETSLTVKQVRTGQKLITTVTANMLDGAYSGDELLPINANLYSVLAGWRIETQDERGRRERDNNLRNFFRSLYRLDQKAEHEGDGRSRDMAAEFRGVLETLETLVLEEELALQPGKR